MIKPASEIVSGVSFLVSSEPETKASGIQSWLKDSLAIRPIDQKEAKFPLLATGVQSANVNYQEAIFLNT